MTDIEKVIATGKLRDAQWVASQREHIVRMQRKELNALALHLCADQHAYAKEIESYKNRITRLEKLLRETKAND